jgi:hypothetical protein
MICIPQTISKVFTKKVPPGGYPFFRMDSPVIRRPGIYFYDDANERRHTLITETENRFVFFS